MDENNNNIPDAWDKRISVALNVVLMVLWATMEWFGSTYGLWAARIAILIGMLGNHFGWGLQARPGKTNGAAPSATAIVFLLAFLLALAPLSGCPSKYAIVSNGYRTLGLIEDAGEETDRQVAKWLLDHGAKCLAAHKSRSAPEYATCISPKRETRSIWKKAVTGMNAFLELAKGALRAFHAWLDGAASIEAACKAQFGSEKHKGYAPCVEAGKSKNWMVLLKPIICAGATVLERLKDAIPGLKPAASWLALAKGVTCG